MLAILGVCYVLLCHVFLIFLDCILDLQKYIHHLCWVSVLQHHCTYILVQKQGNYEKCLDINTFFTFASITSYLGYLIHYWTNITYTEHKHQYKLLFLIWLLSIHIGGTIVRNYEAINMNYGDFSYFLGTVPAGS